MAVCRLPPPVPILSAAVWRRSRDLAALGLGSVLVFAVPHAAYHLVHGSGPRLDAGLGASVGAYGRKQGSTDPRLAYTPGLLWLTEALGEDPDTVRRAIAAVEAGPAPGGQPVSRRPRGHPRVSSPTRPSPRVVGGGGPTTPAPPSTVGESRWSSAISPTVAMRRGQTGVSRSSRRCASSSSR